MICKAELDELYRADDKVRAEHRAWLAQCEAAASPLVQRNDNAAGLVFKTTDNALLPAPAVDVEAFDDEEPWFNERQLDGLAVVIAELRKEFRQQAEIHAARVMTKTFEQQAAEIAELRGQLAAVLQLIGQKSFKAADVIDLPNWRRHGSAG